MFTRFEFYTCYELHILNVLEANNTKLLHMHCMVIKSQLVFKLRYYIHVVTTRACYIICFFKQTTECWFLAKINLPARIDDTFLVILSTTPTRIMSWPVRICCSVEEIIIRGSGETNSSSIPQQSIRYFSATSCCNILYIFTNY